MPMQVHGRQEYAILTHVRSGASLLADLLARNGIGNADERLSQSALAKTDCCWDPQEVLAAARYSEQTNFFGSTVMVHWLDDLKRRTGFPASSDAQILQRLFGAGFITIHLFRSDTVAAAVSFTLVELSGQWGQIDGHAVGDPAKSAFRLPRWTAMEPLISDNVAWLDAGKERLAAAAAALMPKVVEIRYEDLVGDEIAQLRRAANAIPGVEGRSLNVTGGHAGLPDERVAELCVRWRAEHLEYGPPPVPGKPGC